MSFLVLEDLVVYSRKNNSQLEQKTEIRKINK